MLSHMRKAIERAVVDELDEIITPDRMQYGFQRAINTLQAALDVAAILNEAIEHLIAVLDLTKEYDRVVRAILIQKIESMNIPKDLVAQITIFLVPLIVKTAGDETHTLVALTTGLKQGGAASPALFRVFIDDLASELRKAQGKEAVATGFNLADPAKLVADDVVLPARSEVELQALLDTCTSWAAKNGLEWKPEKCSVVGREVPNTLIKSFQLVGKTIPLSTSARYLGIMVTHRGFTKAANKELEKKVLLHAQPLQDSPSSIQTSPLA